MTAVRISTASGRVRVIAGTVSEVTVDGDARVSTAADTTTVESASGAVTVRVPEGTDLTIGSASGRVTVEGPAGDVAVTSASGRVEVESGVDVDVRSQSGRVTIERARGEARVRVTSGRIEIDACAGADVATESGRITLRRVDGPVRAHCVSGRVTIDMAAPHDVDADTVSGRIHVTMPKGTRVHHLAGKGDETPPPPGADCSVRATSVSGRVRVEP